MLNITRIDTDQGRFYETPGGKFPSVNTILDVTMSPEDKARLSKWRKKNKDLPKQEGEISAAERGTMMHEAIAEFLANRSLVNSELHPTVEPFWKSIKPWLLTIGKSATVSFPGSSAPAIAIELPVYHSQLKYAGTLDAYCKLKDKKNYVIDFKTSNKMKSKGSIKQYCLQCAAYSLVLESQNRKVDGFIVPIIYKI